MELEDRTVPAPAYFRWNPPGDNYNWHVADNWDEAAGNTFVDNQTGRHPGADDKVEFSSVPLVAGEPGPGVRSAPICIVSVPTTVHYLWLKPDFTATVFLDQPLAVDSLSDRGYMNTAGSAGTIAGGFGGGHGQLDR